MGLKSYVLNDSNNIETDKLQNADIICYNGFCSVHQLFTSEHVDFFRKKFPDIKVAVHPECDPSITKKADFVGSTSQLISYVQNLPESQKVVVGTEFNMVNRLRKKNTYILSSTKPECSTMNETTLTDLYNTLKSIENKNPFFEIQVDEKVQKYAKLALNKMLEL
jgi:quinolinate synthase